VHQCISTDLLCIEVSATEKARHQHNATQTYNSHSESRVAAVDVVAVDSVSQLTVRT